MNYEQKQELMTELNNPAYAPDLTAQNYQAIADTLNARESIGNPVPQATQPKLIAWDVFLNLLEPADILELFLYGELAHDLHEALNANDRLITMAIWRGLKTVLTASSIAAVQAEAAATEPDPNWQPTILQSSIAQGLGLGNVSARDVQSAHHRMAGV